MTYEDEPRQHLPNTGPLHAVGSAPSALRAVGAAIVVLSLTGGAVYGMDWYGSAMEPAADAAGPAPSNVVIVTPSPELGADVTAEELVLTWGPTVADMTAARET